MPEGIGYDDLEATLSAEEQSERLKEEARKKQRQHQELIEKWVNKIKQARSHDRPARLQWADDRRVARGDTDWLVDTNLIGAILEVLAAFLYAKNPDISIKPSPTANRKMLKEYRAVGETLEIMDSRMLKDAGLKRIAKRWVRSAMTVGVGWIKCAMQTRNERDPMVEQQINDLQQNMERIKVLAQDIKDGDEDDTGAQRAEIESQILALEGQLERQVADGLVLDLVAPEDVIVSPECGEIVNYLQAPWIAFDMYKDKYDAMEITGWSKEQLKTANLYTQRPRKGETDDEGHVNTNATQWVSLENSDNEDAENPDGFYRFIEIWSIKDGVVYTYVDGVTKDWARDPYAPRTGKRFYPNVLLAFHPIDGDRWPQSDVYQLKSLQDEYGRTRSNYSEHRRRAVPGIIFDKEMVHEESVSDLSGSVTQEYTGIRTKRPGTDLRTVFTPKVYNQVDMALYDTEKITQEMEKVSGAQDAVQGGIQVEKTATEAQILESGRGARTGMRLDELEDALTELAEYSTQLILLTMDQSDAIRYAGPEAVWVDMNTEQALTLFNVEIKAGSTGKPKALSDREAWGTLMPLIEGMIDRVGHARMQGQEWAAKPWIALLHESMNRLDDHADIEKFLPSPPPEIVAAMSNQELSEKEESEIRNKDADSLKKLAETLEKNPLFITPAMQIVQEIDAQEQQQESPAAEPAPAAPSPLPTGIN
jgi:hypothetical protein